MDGGLNAIAGEIPALSRFIDRCDHCHLRQYVLPSGMCRRCKRSISATAPPIDLPTTPTTPTTPAVIPRQRTQPAVTQSWHNTVPVVILYLRLRAGMSQNDFARKFGTARTWISRIENGDVLPTVANLYRVAWALGVEVELIVRMCEFLSDGKV